MIDVPDLDGLYLDMDEATYHALPRLSSSGICNLLVSPGTFWARSWLNDNKPDDDTLARKLGRAYDIAILTPAEFPKRYVRALEHDDEDALTTMSQISVELQRMGLPMKKAGETALQQAHRLRAAGYRGPIKHLDEEDWEIERNGREGLRADIFDQVVTDAERVHQDPDVGKLLQGGEAQVSVLWTDPQGMKWKARFDRIKPGVATDVKTFSNPNGKRLDQCVADAVRFNRYYIQATIYHGIAERIRAGDVRGRGANAERFVEAIRAGNPFEWWWVFRETGGIPNVLARQFRMTADAHPHHLYQAPNPDSSAEYAAKLAKPSQIVTKARAEIAMAVSIYRQASEVWGTEEPWGVLQPVGEIGDEDFNHFWLEE